MKELKEGIKKDDYPKLKNGQVDFMTIILNMFQGQLGVVNYVQGICKGYALDKSLETASNLMKRLDEGKTQLTMDDIIPTDIKPNNDTVTVSDTKN